MRARPTKTSRRPSGRSQPHIVDGAVALQKTFACEVLGKHGILQQPYSALTYQHYRDTLEKENLDAVFVETTTHARVLICIHAMQAGCDTYVEKPQSLAVAEGRVLVRLQAGLRHSPGICRKPQRRISTKRSSVWASPTS